MKELQAAAKLKDSERLASLAHTLKGSFIELRVESSGRIR
jgi:hypothetical protein